MAKINTPNGTAIAVLLGGVVLVYSGIKGAGVADTLRAFLKGHEPNAVPFNVADSGTVGDGTGDAAAVIEKAQTQLGKPYKFGSPQDFTDPNPKAFDCSGLVGWSYFQGANITLHGHNTNAFYYQLGKKPLAQATPGDLIFYGNAVDKHHVALYMGDNQVIEAPAPNIPVRTRHMSQGEAPYSQVGVFPGGTVSSATAGEGGAGISGNKALALAMAAAYGWIGAEWTDLDSLWTRESGFDNHVINPTSNALGIAQALGHGTGSSAAQCTVHVPGGKDMVMTMDEYPSKLANSGDAGAQIAWGLNYIHARYGKPSAAWQHELSAGWY